ncbi:MAG: hypothetical protein SGARI_007828 [Bacillariaceae sp.]
MWGGEERPPSEYDWEQDSPIDENYEVPDNTCGITEYRHIWNPADCASIVQQPDHPNSYWENENFLCRLNERPCGGGSRPYTLNLPDKTVEVPASYDGGEGEVWLILGQYNETSSCFEFWAEGHWY